MNSFDQILNKTDFCKTDIEQMLLADGENKKKLFDKALEIKKKEVGKEIYYRGLVEFSNICNKNCFYCGIRKDNKKIERFNISDKQIIEAAMFAYNNNYGSFVMQSGEIISEHFTKRVEDILKTIKQKTNGQLGITISLGEQTKNTYQRWFNAGAHRYLLRIESSNKELFYKIHPNNKTHDFDNRLQCLKTLQNIGYQVGTGVMIGLPFQTIEHLADDILFMKNFDIDMVGMGPYIEHPDTPLIQYHKNLIPLKERLNLALKMIATLRIVMRDINIAAATALQAIDPNGREKAISTGANIVMPNITPSTFRNKYKLYNNKPRVDENKKQALSKDANLQLNNSIVAYGKWGDSKHFYKRKKINI